MESSRVPRLDSSLESIGAEFLVLGQLLIQGIQCYKSYVNHPGYDLIATNPNKNISRRIQVKSRWATDYNKSFPIKNFDCDFVVLVALNRGNRYRKSGITEEPRPPEYFIFPVSAVKKARNNSSKWGTVRLANIPDHESYKDKWSLVADSLS
jgi:hypothetical protein